MSDLPVGDGSCGGCGGPVNVLGCVVECEASQLYRIPVPYRGWSSADKLAVIGGLAEQAVRERKPEFVDQRLVEIYRIAVLGW